MSYIDKTIGMLPDAYSKDKSSNNYKLFSCIAPELDLVMSTMIELRKCLDVDYAYGKTLDKIATNVNQVRGSTNDTVLRTLVKAKIAADMSEGTISTILDVIGFIIGDDVGKSQIVELYNGYESEVATFQIIAPVEGVANAGLSLGQFVQLMVNIKAAGVKVVADLQGTFEFGEISEYGSEFIHGFANEEQTEGGTLGILYDPNDDDPLPL